MVNGVLEFLVSNDDGIESVGIHRAVDFLLEYGNVFVVAPDTGQSGKSASLNLEIPLRCKQRGTTTKCGHTATWVSLNGTPVDCVKMAMHIFFQDHNPDFCFSGINLGSNASVAAVYSGTLGAAAEATIYDIPTIAFSIDSHNPEPNFSQVNKFYDTILRSFFATPPKPGCYLNVNFPAIEAQDVKGILFTRMGRGRWIKEFVDEVDPRGRPFCWMVGWFEDLEEKGAKESTNGRGEMPSTSGMEHPSVDERLKGDHQMIKKNYITITVHKIDNSDAQEAERLSAEWGLNK